MEGGSVRIWDWLIGASGLVLFISVFLHWFDHNKELWSAWDAISVLRLVLLFTGAVAMSVPLVAALKATDKQTQSLLVAVAVLATIALVWTIVRVANPPSLDLFDYLPLKRLAGGFVAIGAEAVMLICALVGMRTRLARRARV